MLIGLTNANVDLSPFDLIIRDIRIKGSLCYPTTLWPRIYSMIRSGLLPVEKLIDAEISLLNLVEDGFKPLIDPAGTKLKILVDLNA